MSATPAQGHDSVAVANQFILIANKHGNPIRSATKLSKLIYIAHGYYLALRGKSLIKDGIEAWAYGPIVPESGAAAGKR